MKKVESPLLVESVARACDLLTAFEHEDEVLRLRDFVSRTGLNPATVLRLLGTLEKRGFVERIRKNRTAQFGDTLDLVRKHVQHTRARRILIGAVNDPCALGALRAFEEAGLPENCAVMGQGGSAEGRAELRRPGTRLVGSVAFFPEKYGQRIISLALDILNKKPVPPAVFADHQLLTPINVDHFYPSDVLTSPLNHAAGFS